MSIIKWTDKDSLEASAEGWDIWDCGDSDNGRWQIQSFDDPDTASDVRGVPVPRLESDDVAWQLVLHGDKPHHAKARDFIRINNPIEWAAMTKEQA